MIKAITFDFDDTLVLSWKTHGKEFIEVAKRLGLDTEKLGDLKANWGKTISKLLSIVWEMDKEEQAEYIKEWRKIEQVTPPVPGLKKTMIELRKRDIQLGIVTSRHNEPLFSAMKEISLAKEEFLFIQCGDDHKFQKDDPRCFNLPIEQFREKGITQDEILHVGDSLYDYEGAKAAGIGFVAVTSGPATKEMFIAAGVPEDHIILDVNYLPALLDSIYK